MDSVKHSLKTKTSEKKKHRKKKWTMKSKRKF